MGLPIPSRFPRFSPFLTALRDTLQVPLCFDVSSENRLSGRRAASFSSAKLASGGRRAASFFLRKAGFGRGTEGPS